MQIELNPREQEIFDLLLEKTAPKEIAFKMNVSYSTVDHYRSKLYRKLGVRNKHELLKKYSKDKNTLNTVETEIDFSANTAEKLSSSSNKTKKVYIFVTAAFLIVICILILIIRNLHKSYAPELSSTVTDMSDFIIYDDYLSDGITFQSYSQHSIIDLRSATAAQGEYAIHWSNIGKDHGIKFWFPVRDLTFYAQNEYVLEFKVRTVTLTEFEIRFFNLDDDIAWLTGNSFLQKIRPDGMWHTFRLPLKDMFISSGINEATMQRYPAQGRIISWKNVYALEFYSILDDGNTQEIFLDDIKITK